MGREDRRTGKTTRMLEAAIAARKAGDEVVVLAPYFAMQRALERRLREMDAPHGIRVTTVETRTEAFRGLNNLRVFDDHSVAEWTVLLDRLEAWRQFQQECELTHG